MFYKFEKELKEAIIINRPNRFIMEIIVDGKKEKAHCPSTGRIGNFDFKNTPCLVSESDNKIRKTKFTVEAISPQKPENKRKNWIGINQGKSNSYVEYFLRNNFFKDMIKDGEKAKREKKLGNSRIDFRVENNFIEVKTFVANIPFGEKKSVAMSNNQKVLNRLIKHFSDLSNFAKEEKGRAIVLICNQYDAERFEPPKNAANSKVGIVVKRAIINGVENWQVNMKIDKKGVYFLDYFKLDFLDKL